MAMEAEVLAATAAQVAAFMRNEGAVRLDEATVGKYLTRDEIADGVDFYIGDWTTIKETMLGMGMHICYTPGKGHYLGFEGEEIANVVYAWKYAKGWRRRVSAYLDPIRQRADFERNGQAYRDRAWQKFNVNVDEILNDY